MVTADSQKEKKGTPTEEELEDDEDFAADRAHKAEQAEVTRPPNRG